MIVHAQQRDTDETESKSQDGPQAIWISEFECQKIKNHSSVIVNIYTKWIELAVIWLWYSQTSGFIRSFTHSFIQLVHKYILSTFGII